MTTHYLEEADSIADRVVVVNQGKIIADGTLDEIKESAGNRHVSFTAGSNVKTHQLLDLPGVADVQWAGHRVKVYGSDTDGLLYALIRSDLDIHDIETHKGGLEDAFQSLVGSPEAV